MMHIKQTLPDIKARISASLQKYTAELNQQLFRRYPLLKEKIHQVVISFFKKVMDPTNKLVKDLVAMEACYINTGHPDFLNGHRVGYSYSSLSLPKHK